MSESDIEEYAQCTPPEIYNLAEIVSLDLLPTKSKVLYEKSYNGFVEWKKVSKVESSSESTLKHVISKSKTRG